MTVVETLKSNGAGHTEAVPVALHTDNTRLEAFSDAIFGFAATLLVVSLDVPTSYDELVKSLYGFLAFGMSFGALVGIWTIHREFFRRYPLGDGRIVVLNTLLLFLVLFFVYPLKFLARVLVIFFLRQHYAGESVRMSLDQVPGMFIIYGVGWTAVFGCFALMYAHARKRSELLDFGPDDVRLAADRTGHFAVMALIGVVSIVLAAAGVGVHFGVPGWTYALTGPVLSIYWNRRNKRNGSA